MAEITMPHLGESVTEGTIGRWLKQPGEHVEQDEPLVEVTTDKVNTEMPAPVGGVLQAIVAPEGAVVAVGAQIATITVAGEATIEEAVPDPAPVTNQAAGEASGPSTAVAESAPAAPAEATTRTAVEAPSETTEGAGERRRFTPVVMRLAEQHDIPFAELAQVPGTGLGGRVNKQDLLDYIAAQGKSPRQETPAPPAQQPIESPRPIPQVPAPRATAASPLAPAPTPAPTPAAQPAAAPRSQSSSAPGETVALTPMRRAIGDHMVRSLATAPHAWTMIEVDMTRLVRFRTAQNAAFRAREGFSLSYVPFVVEATIAALREFPILNSSFGEGGITLKRELNIGLAVALPDQAGLLVPTIKGADSLSLLGLARAVNDLALRARAGRLTNDDLSGGTFTVNNSGSYGSVLSQPIINQPQSAIMTMEAIVKRPVVVTDPNTGDDSFAIRSIMNVCLSFDHRILDGQTAGLFLGSIRQRLEGFSGAAGI